MSLWRIARDEVAGAWRSLRYDLRRRSDADIRTDAAGGLLDDAFRDDDEFDRPPRRMVAVSAFSLLAVIGAAGSYFAVVNGLGSLLTEPSGTDTYPLAAEAGPLPVTTERQGPTSRLGYGSTIAPSPAPQVAPVRRKRAHPAPEATAEPSGSVTRPTRTVTATPSPCRCSPPAPVPTFPDGDPTTSPSPTPSASVSPSVSAGPSPSASRDSADDGYGTGGRDRSRGHSGY
jgi:hypothetical protein